MNEARGGRRRTRSSPLALRPSAVVSLRRPPSGAGCTAVRFRLPRARRPLYRPAAGRLATIVGLVVDVAGPLPSGASTFLAFDHVPEIPSMPIGRTISSPAAAFTGVADESRTGSVTSADACSSLRRCPPCRFPARSCPGRTRTPWTSRFRAPRRASRSRSTTRPARRGAAGSSSTSSRSTRPARCVRSPPTSHRRAAAIRDSSAPSASTPATARARAAAARRRATIGTPARATIAAPAAVRGHRASRRVLPLDLRRRESVHRRRPDDGGSCRKTPIAATCWRLVVHGTLFVTALGRTCSCGLPQSSGVLALRDDGGYQIPGGHAEAALCTTGHAVDFPDEVGRWRRTGRVRMLAASNLDDELAATLACTGSDILRVRGYHTRVRLSRDAMRLRGRQVLRGRWSAPRQRRRSSRASAACRGASPTAPRRRRSRRSSSRRPRRGAGPD